MYFRGFTFWLIWNIMWNPVLASSPDSETSRSENKDSGTSHLASTSLNNIIFETCSQDDFACLSVASSDKLGLEAIKSLHKKLDDDENGNVDLSESDDFLREELKYDSGYERRQKAFHRNDDMHISVKELWEAWLRSEVHNWTVEQTTEWLTSSIDLPQYIPNFIQYKVTGAHLPRMAVNTNNYLSLIGIKDPIHRHKISLKAMDVVLFGPPKDGQPHWKDLILIILIIGVGVGIWHGYQQNKKFRTHLTRMNHDMDSLQNAEKELQTIQKELTEAKQAQETVATEKKHLEKILQDSKGDSDSLHNSYSDLEITQLKAELSTLRSQLEIAEGELKDRSWAPPYTLQQWLQLTYEVENKYFVKKKIIAEKQLQQAREACEKLRKKRSSLIGAFVSTHGKSIDEVDRSIVEARTALNEVTHELQERVHRWNKIEQLCSFNVMNNNGLQYLETVLYRNNGRTIGFKGRSQDDLDDDIASIYGNHPGHVETGLPIHQTWKEGDSSGSEASKLDDEYHCENKIPGQSVVHFLVGGETSSCVEESPSNLNLKSSKLGLNAKSVSNNNIVVNVKPATMTRSYSQETTMSLTDTLTKSKSSQSDNSFMEHQARTKSLRAKTIKEQPSISMEDDICSTDSSLLDEDLKKKKRKLFNFKKGKPKAC